MIDTCCVSAREKGALTLGDLVVRFRMSFEVCRILESLLLVHFLFAFGDMLCEEER